MPEKIPTQEMTRIIIKIALERNVNLINGIINGTQMQNEPAQEKVRAIAGSVHHLSTRMKLDWFIKECTDTEKADINVAITTGKAYIADNNKI